MTRHIRAALPSDDCARLATAIAELAPSNDNVRRYSFFPAGIIPWAVPIERRIDRLTEWSYVRAICGYFITREISRFDWHTDAQFDGALPGITIWIPLHDCGIDRPSLETEDGRHVCAAGDALIFSSFARHRTFVPDDAKYSDRIAAVFRYRSWRHSSLRQIAYSLSHRIRR